MTAPPCSHTPPYFFRSPPGGSHRRRGKAQRWRGPRRTHLAGNRLVGVTIGANRPDTERRKSKQRRALSRTRCLEQMGRYGRQSGGCFLEFYHEPVRGVGGESASEK